jgi:hypothetical protein
MAVTSIQLWLTACRLLPQVPIIILYLRSRRIASATVHHQYRFAENEHAIVLSVDLKAPLLSHQRHFPNPCTLRSVCSQDDHLHSLSGYFLHFVYPHDVHPYSRNTLSFNPKASWRITPVFRRAIFVPHFGQVSATRQHQTPYEAIFIAMCRVKLHSTALPADNNIVGTRMSIDLSGDVEYNCLISIEPLLAKP